MKTLCISLLVDVTLGSTMMMPTNTTNNVAINSSEDLLTYSVPLSTNERSSVTESSPVVSPMAITGSRNSQGVFLRVCCVLCCCCCCNSIRILCTCEKFYREKAISPTCS